MGLPKAELSIHGIPILQHLLARWNWPGPTLLITAPDREHPPGSELFTAEHPDPDIPESAGPLRGILTALTHCTTPQLIIATVDMPAVPAALLHHLADQLHNQPTDVLGLMLSHPAGNQSQLGPFPLALRTSALPVVQSRLAGPRHSVIGLAELHGFTTLPAPLDLPPNTWANLNTPADYAAFIASTTPPAL